jgi:hypothetical protein
MSSLPTLTPPAGLNVQTHSISTLLLNHESGGSRYNNNMVVASIPLVKITSLKAFLHCTEYFSKVANSTSVGKRETRSNDDDDDDQQQ